MLFSNLIKILEAFLYAPSGHRSDFRSVFLEMQFQEIHFFIRDV